MLFVGSTWTEKLLTMLSEGAEEMSEGLGTAVDGRDRSC